MLEKKEIDYRINTYLEQVFVCSFAVQDKTSLNRLPCSLDS